MKKKTNGSATEQKATLSALHPYTPDKLDVIFDNLVGDKLIVLTPTEKYELKFDGHVSCKMIEEELDWDLMWPCFVTKSGKDGYTVYGCDNAKLRNQEFNSMGSALYCCALGLLSEIEDDENKHDREREIVMANARKGIFLSGNLLVCKNRWFHAEEQEMEEALENAPVLTNEEIDAMISEISSFHKSEVY